MPRTTETTDYFVAADGSIRQPHTHSVCTIGPDPLSGHDHYCDLEEEGCENDECFGEDPHTGARLFPVGRYIPLTDEQIEQREAIVSHATVRVLISWYANGGAIQKFASTGAIDPSVRAYVKETIDEFRWTRRQQRELFAIDRYLHVFPDRSSIPGWSNLPWPTGREIRIDVQRCWEAFH